MNYHIADFLVRIKNASLANRKQVLMPYSNSTKAIGNVLVKEGFLEAVQEETIDGKKMIRASLRYVRRRPVVTGVKIVSKPSLRVYTPIKDMNPSKEKAMTVILSTSMGIMTGKEARKKGVGGELLFHIW